jgi:hypothetical protein
LGIDFDHIYIEAAPLQHSYGRSAAALDVSLLHLQDLQYAWQEFVSDAARGHL